MRPRGQDSSPAALALGESVEPEPDDGIVGHQCRLDLAAQAAQGKPGRRGQGFNLPSASVPIGVTTASASSR